MSKSNTAQRPAMSASDALRFATFSPRSYERTERALSTRARAECQCEPYSEDSERGCFTFGRWIALGYCVRKGEKSLRLETWVPLPGKSVGVPAEDLAESRKVTLRPKTVHLFCRCQVERK